MPTPSSTSGDRVHAIVLHQHTRLESRLRAELHQQQIGQQLLSAPFRRGQLPGGDHDVGRVGARLLPQVHDPRLDQRMQRQKVAAEPPDGYGEHRRVHVHLPGDVLLQRYNLRAHLRLAPHRLLRILVVDPASLRQRDALCLSCAIATKYSGTS